MKGVTVQELGQQENELLASNVARFRVPYKFANDVISLMSTGVISVTESRKAFAACHSQITACLCLALLSALRQHRGQVYTNLRLAMESAALAAYALAHPDHAYFLPDSDIDSHKFIAGTVYKWLDEAHPTLSAELARLKKLINQDHAHASLEQSYRHIEEAGGAVPSINVSFPDRDDPLSIQADIIHVGHVGYLALMLIAEANAPVRAIKWRPELPAARDLVQELGRKAIDAADRGQLA